MDYVISNLIRALHLVNRDLRKAGVYCQNFCLWRGSAPCRIKGTYSRLEKHWKTDDYGLPVAQIGAQVIGNLVWALHVVHMDLRKAGVYCQNLCFGRGSTPCHKKGTYSRLEKH